MSRVIAWWHQHDMNPGYLVILVIVLVLFGGSELPELANSLGRSIGEFKKGIGAEPEAEQAPTPQPMAAPQAGAHCKNPNSAAPQQPT